MAIASNNSEEQVAGGGVSLYTGIAPVKVVAVNPTLQELHDLGIKVKEEPSYSVTFSKDDGTDREFAKVVFWVEHAEPNFKTKVEFLVQNTPRANKDGGKFQWVNNKAQFSWGATSPAEVYDWFKDEGVRKAFVGEDALISFVRAWANVGNDGDCYLDTMAKIVTGDVTELKQLVSALAENKLRVLLGVKDEKYQQVYLKHFGRLKPKRDDLFVKQLNDDYGAFNAEIGKDLSFQNYVPGLVSADAENTEVEAEDSPW